MFNAKACGERPSSGVGRCVFHGVGALLELRTRISDSTELRLAAAAQCAWAPKWVGSLVRSSTLGGGRPKAAAPVTAGQVRPGDLSSVGSAQPTGPPNRRRRLGTGWSAG